MHTSPEVPKISEQPGRDSKIPPTPLSSNSKQKLLKQIRQADPKALQNTLIAAALNLYQFPYPLSQKVEPLQLAYKEHSDNANVKSCLKDAIEAYITTRGLEQFQELLQKEDFNERNWSSNFLLRLARFLQVIPENESVVEAAIQDGKVYWRIIKDNEVICQRHDFNKTNAFRMSWDQFRLFKDAGKRSGTVAITKERFTSYYTEEYREQATSIWDELKQKGILNLRNRLSNGWRAIVNHKIILHSLTNSEIVISKKEVIDHLRYFNTLSILKDSFVGQWPHNKQYRASLIWEELKQQKILDDNNKLAKNLRKVKISDFLNSLHLGYESVVTTLYKIANSREYGEILHYVSNRIIYREERTLKSWKSAGLVTNKDPANKKYSVKRWDVGIYHDLSLHRNTDEEIQANNGDKLNYDHIPSSDTLKSKANTLLEKNDVMVKSLQTEKDKVMDAIKKRAEEVGITHVTRNVWESHKALHEPRDQFHLLEEKLKQLIDERDQINSECMDHGNLWWTIAISEKLHTQGQTFFKSSQEQQKSSENPFLSNVRTYLDILEERPDHFSLNLDDYIEALGAFRYLYRCQLKSQTAVNGKHHVGIVPRQAFFQNPEERQAIDKLFFERIQRYISQREGFNEEENNNPHFRRQLFTQN